ncbi:GH25 family lysozyme M1 (1,4-beta-N-acetylmuramidase) [Saccharopolyspora erythraea NRRL 2338]|uniref:lysozyme n=2 Tax=Saccharopolyspora erythraea TaxID=1836 RepID=A4F7M2_SACEN|nr:lysozyme [Saccharopolyspora erythraea]EQD87045.1 glycoside hydrolase [Saccharopolyspora erythraea D]PFG93850.1 GH25 family lysozyme M1 (1,4-beta-N-acetylmuramidase) [Saccharopolyspora erythraea NRRL 2338]QRK90675.1 lysozyme [Saccharopolyspora erythraea]CAM00046.1 lysozyme M1 precursor [Saccharopolyspora erythraea NRRL 2338]
MNIRRKLLVVLASSAALLASVPGAANADSAAADALGIDVSNHNGEVDFAKVGADGRDFAFVLATDGESFTSDLFDSQYSGAGEAGLYRAGYHFARPDGSATKQADRFLKTVGYTNDGRTMPPVLDMEANPNGATCYGLDDAQMEEWIKSFVGRVKEKTGREAVIYTSPSFWKECTGNSEAFTSNPLWTAEWDVDKPSKVGGWPAHTFWQYSNSGKVDGVDGAVDVNRFNGGTAELEKFVKG